MSTPQPPYPLNPEIEKLLDPQYTEFYNKYIINQQQVHYQPVLASRSSGVLIPGASEKKKVAKTEDIEIPRKYSEGDNLKLRVFTPDLPKPANGYPLFLYFHGGGWVLGNIDTENVHCTNWASRGECLVVDVDYRLAPEDPYPACVEDAWEAYQWLAQGGALQLGADMSNFGAGGSSAGGHLTAVLSHKIIAAHATDSSLPLLKYQILVVPVTDNTASAETQWSWDKYKYTAALPADKMMWYREKFLPDQSTWAEPEASPLFYSDDSFAKCPPAYIAVAGLDVLRAEGEAYHAKLLKNGVKSTLKVYEGVPHPVMAMDGVLDKGAELVTDVCELIYAFAH